MVKGHKEHAYMFDPLYSITAVCCPVKRSAPEMFKGCVTVHVGEGSNPVLPRGQSSGFPFLSCVLAAHPGLAASSFTCINLHQLLQWGFPKLEDFCQSSKRRRVVMPSRSVYG
jgi:hypothetical protein